MISNNINDFIFLCRKCKWHGVNVRHDVEGIGITCKKCGHEVYVKLSPIKASVDVKYNGHEVTQQIKTMFPGVPLMKGIN